MIFAADIGGTNARLGLFERSGTRLGAIATKTYPSGQHASLEEIVERFHGRASGSAETSTSSPSEPPARITAARLAKVWWSTTQYAVRGITPAST